MKIFGIGSTVVDHLVEVPTFPQRDTKAKIARQRKQVGGPVPVALATAAFYGAETILLSRWGEDEAGNYVAANLAQRAVDVSLCNSSTTWQSGFAHVWISTDDGSRTLAAFPGEFPPIVLEDTAREKLSHCSILHLDGTSPDAAIDAANLMKEQRGKIVLDAGSVKPGFDALMPMVDVLIASALFCESRFGQRSVTCGDLLSLGPDVVITTDGERGATCLCKDSDAQIHAPGIGVEAVDTNGAGDIFSGAVLLGISRNWQFEKTLHFANRVAGFACEEYGNDSLRPEKSIR